MNSLWRFLWISLPVGFLLFVTIYIPLKLNDENGFKRVEQISEEVETLKLQNIRLRRSNKSIRRKIESIQSDPDFIENIARNEMGMITPDEVVYQF